MNFIAEMGLGVRHWPADRRIAAAARLNCQAGLEKLWQRLQPEIPAESLALELLRYKPERRLVARVQADECQYLLKAHTAEDFKTIAPKVKQIATYPQVRTAGIVARSWRHAVQLYEWLPGLPLHHASVHYSSAPTRPGHVLPDSETAENIAKVLATLHRAPTAGAERKLASNFPSDSEHTEAARQAIIALVPETETALAHICTQILPILDNPPAHRTLVHNDCSLDQFIRLPDGELALLDWDELDVGDPMTDLAAFAADLYLRASTNGSCQIQSATDWICGFVDAYASAVPDLFCRSRFDAHMAARLLRLAPEPFRRRRLQWRAELIALVELSAASANAPSTDRH